MLHIVYNVILAILIIIIMGLGLFALLRLLATFRDVEGTQESFLTNAMDVVFIMKIACITVFILAILSLLKLFL